MQAGQLPLEADDLIEGLDTMLKAVGDTLCVLRRETSPPLPALLAEGQRRPAPRLPLVVVKADKGAPVDLSDLLHLVLGRGTVLCAQQTPGGADATLEGAPNSGASDSPDPHPDTPEASGSAAEGGRRGEAAGVQRGGQEKGAVQGRGEAEEQAGQAPAANESLAEADLQLPGRIREALHSRLLGVRRRLAGEVSLLERLRADAARTLGAPPYVHEQWRLLSKGPYLEAFLEELCPVAVRLRVVELCSILKAGG